VIAAAAQDKPIYDPSRYFDVATPEQAMAVITNPVEDLITCEERWYNETAYLMTLFSQYIRPGSRVLDYCCGIGRLAQPLIEHLGCTVVGVDFSPAMRAMAMDRVRSPRFCAMDPQLFDELGITKYDAVIAIWALQHCIDLRRALTRIATHLRPGGALIVVDHVYRCVPVGSDGWENDGLDLTRMLGDVGFFAKAAGRLDPKIAPGWMQDSLFSAVYR